MLDSIYYMALRILWNLISGVKEVRFCHYVSNVVMDVITLPYICKLLVVCFIMHVIISHPDATSKIKIKSQFLLA